MFAALLALTSKGLASGHLPPYDDGFHPSVNEEWTEPPATRPAPTKLGTAGVLGPSMNARRQPAGALSNIIIYCSAGHGFHAETNLSAWYVGRGLTNGVVEDMGNVDQLNFFVQYCFNAGATIVPFRPVGYQTNEFVIDNDDAQAVFSGTWATSSSTIFFGTAGDVPYRYAYINTNSETATARYRPNLSAAGYYPVYGWTRCGSDRVRQLYRIHHSGGDSEVRVHHRRVGLGWVWLGNYYFEKGTNAYVDISNYAPGYTSGSDVVIADAIRFGNGMGDVSRGFGVSGQPRELECARYWIQRGLGQGMDAGIYDLGGYDDESDNVGAPRRMTEEMNRESDGGFWDRLYLGFHSNAGGTTPRGAMGLYDTRYDLTTRLRQQAFGQALVDELTNDMEWADSGVFFNDDWVQNSAAIYGDLYGEIYGNISNEMNNTIIEVAYHDKAADAYLLKDPPARSVIARACYQAIVKHLNANNSSNVPLALLPDPPTHVRAVNSGRGRVTVSWQAPATNGAGGDDAAGYVVYVSSNGYGFGSPVELAGATNTSLTFTNLQTNATWYFQVAAVNAGGESLPSETVGVRAAPDGRAWYLVVNGFDRCDRSLCPTPYFANNIGGNVTLVRPLQVNSYDYVIQHGEAIEASGRYFDSCNHMAITSGAVRLTNYHAAFWILGEESTVDETFSSAEQSSVILFLSGNGCLFVSGAELAWDLGRQGTAADQAFMTNWLRTGYSGDDAATNRVTGKTGTVFDGLATLSFDDGSGPTYNVDYPDLLAAASGSVACLAYGSAAGGSSVAGLQYSNACRLVVLGFPFETLLAEGGRTDVMARVVRFFGDPERYDGDGDGMPDLWEIEHFTNGTAAAATDDADGDGANNWQEWVAGTTPTNDSSRFEVASASAATGGTWRLTWPSASNRVYDVEHGTNLSQAFVFLATNLPATPALNTYTVSVNGVEFRVFRVRVRF